MTQAEFARQIEGSDAPVGSAGPQPEAFENALQYLAQIIHTRLALHFGQKTSIARIEDVPLPSVNGARSPYTDFLGKHDLSIAEHVILLLALAPHLQPDFFDQVITQALPQSGDFPQIGGVRGKQFRGFLPTGETALFVLAGNDLERRFELQELFSENHFFAVQQVLRVEEPESGEPKMSGKLVMDQDYVDRFTTGHMARPRFSMEFPAQLITTALEWEDLVLPESTHAQIRELEAWVKHGDTLLHDWGMKKRVKPGYRALFHGPAGTGKTLTASLLGKYTGRDVYRVDLSMVVSKFIGETEKNLANLFNKAENRGWILFFDEADALFGKRTNVRDAHDKYANQEVAYLLQRIEECDGLIILASNLKSNIDDAFMRRFQSIIQFPTPGINERWQIWKSGFPDAVRLDRDVDLQLIARKYELTGAGIVNVVQYCCLQALSRDEQRIGVADIENGIRREFSKEGKLQ